MGFLILPEAVQEYRSFGFLVLCWHQNDLCRRANNQGTQHGPYKLRQYIRGNQCPFKLSATARAYADLEGFRCAHHYKARSNRHSTYTASPQP